MNIKLKLGIPVAIIIVTLVSAILAGSMSGYKPHKSEKAEVTIQTIDHEDILTKSKPEILLIINSNITQSSKSDKEVVLNGIENHMEQFDQGKNQDFKNLLEHKLQDLEEVISIEKKTSFQHMSLDARIPAMKMLSDICEQYGIQVTYNQNGNIVKISKLSGATIYENEMVKDNYIVRVEVFAIILIAIIFFIAICIYIAKKKQLFIKDGMYDGYNKEGFA